METKLKKYLSACNKDTLIELYLQMRFERDLYIRMYDDLKSIAHGADKGWTLEDKKVKYGYELARKEIEDDELDRLKKSIDSVKRGGLG